jgi:membrane associated rhomboid family serine protease
VNEPTDAASPRELGERPRGWRYFARTWSGRIVVVNTIMFLVLVARGHEIMMPSVDVLIACGAKDPVRLAAGEWWRLVTPIFLHVGLIHYAVNTYMFNVIGYPIEVMLGGPWFVAIYLASGIMGNVASAVFSVNLSAGASGAIFGLLGIGLYLERTMSKREHAATGRKPRQRAYAMTVLINLVFGILVPFIDNAAHIGGLVAGFVLTFAMVRWRSNALVARHRGVAVAAAAGLAALAGVGVYFGTSSRYLADGMLRAAERADAPGERVHYLSQAIAIDPEDPAPRLERAELLLRHDETAEALRDLRVVVGSPAQLPRVRALAEALARDGLLSAAWEVRRLLPPEDAPSP